MVTQQKECALFSCNRGLKKEFSELLVKPSHKGLPNALVHNYNEMSES